MDLVGPAGVVTKAGNTFIEVAERVAVRLAVIPSLNRRQDLFLLLGEVRQLKHERTALGSADIAPGFVVQRGSRRRDRFVHVLGRSGFYRTDVLLITVDRPCVSTV